MQAFQNNLIWSSYFVGIAAILDFLDGFAARMLGVSSPIGKDLDSLADMVTFGLVPGIVMYKLIWFSLNAQIPTFLPSTWNPESGEMVFWQYAAFLIPVFSAIRLAKFNNDTRQSESFIGLPTPANAIFICSLPLILFVQYSPISSLSDPGSEDVNWPWVFINDAKMLLFITIAFSFLLLAPLPLFALKFKSFGWKGNEIRYLFLSLSLVLVVVFQFVGIPLVIVLYILISLVNNLFFKPKTPQSAA